MYCKDCQYYDCSFRTALGGCNATAPTYLLPAPQKEPQAIIVIPEDYVRLVNKVKDLRDAQKKHKETLNYGYRCLAIRLEKEVDEILEKL